MIQLPPDDRQRIDLAKPIFTFDVNQVALKPPGQRSAEYQHLAFIEFNYFVTGLVEAVVTPQTASEITRGASSSDLIWPAYQRLQKSEWFKARPSGTTLSLSEQDANELWVDMRWTLWPTVSAAQLTDNQRADVSQLFFHSVSSGIAVSNSIFVTVDRNFLNRSDALQNDYGVQVMHNREAWATNQPRYNLVEPTTAEVQKMWETQNELFKRLPGR